MSYKGVFDQKFDVAIYGSGYIGYFAALKAAATGAQVVLFAREQELLWESGRTLCPLGGESDAESWNLFVADLKKRNLAKNDYLDPVGAEIVGTYNLRKNKNIRVVLGVTLIAVETAANTVSSAIVATKNGKRTIQAKKWIDCSEEATLWKLFQPQVTLRSPNAYQYRALILGEGLGADFPRVTGQPMQPEKRSWKNEFTLVGEFAEKQTLNQLYEKTIQSRDALGGAYVGASVCHFSVLPLPIYEGSTQTELPSAGNVICSGPAGTNHRFRTLADRATTGVKAAQSISDLETVATGTVTEKRTLPTRQIRCQILIAGAGTGGAVAALAAERAGAKPYVIDQLAFAGGVGTGGLVNGYFHGQPGGLFEEYDELSHKIWKQLEGVQTLTSSWHHEAKKIAFEQMFSGIQDRFIGLATAYAVVKEGDRITLVKVATPTEIIEFSPRTIIDGTGDGDLAALAGADYEFGREEDRFPLTYSQPALRVENKDGKSIMRRTNFDAGWVDPADAEDLTRARLTGVAHYIRDTYTDESHFIITAPMLGLRQSRQFKTQARLDINDLIMHTEFPEALGATRSCLDTHSIDYEFEDRETAFWLWGCKSFRTQLYADLPYGLLLPPELDNLWLASRSIGVTTPAAYSMRMQRDIQRVGEAAGYAAALAARNDLKSSEVKIDALLPYLEKTGANNPVELAETEDADLIQKLSKGATGPYMWIIYKDRQQYEKPLLEMLESDNENASWLAAVILAVWGNPVAEPRLIKAIENKEKGLPTPALARGAHSQWIDIPNWLFAVTLLKFCGTGKSLPILQKLAETDGNFLNVRTAVGLTLAGMAPRLTESEKDTAIAVAAALAHDEAPDTFVSPSRSIYRYLNNEEQVIMPHEQGSDTREDHTWRIYFAIGKAAKALNRASPIDLTKYLRDERALVREAFKQLT